MSERTAAPGARPKPLYHLLAQTLMRDIENGTLAVGSTLPSEKALTCQHQVSRRTVREALSLLRAQGLIASRPGVGSIVLPPPQAVEHFRPITSGPDLDDFLQQTVLHHISTRVISANEALSDLLECRRGSVLSEACFLRKRDDSALPMSVVRIYLPTQYAAAQITPKVSTVPIYRNLERMFGLAVAEIRQDVMATVLDRTTAGLLQAAPGDPALQVIRFYYAASGQLIEVAVGLYPSSRFRQSARYTR